MENEASFHDGDEQYTGQQWSAMRGAHKHESTWNSSTTMISQLHKITSSR